MTFLCFQCCLLLVCVCVLMSCHNRRKHNNLNVILGIYISFFFLCCRISFHQGRKGECVGGTTFGNKYQISLSNVVLFRNFQILNSLDRLFAKQKDHSKHRFLFVVVVVSKMPAKKWQLIKGAYGKKVKGKLQLLPKDSILCVCVCGIW